MKNPYLYLVVFAIALSTMACAEKSDEPVIPQMNDERYYSEFLVDESDAYSQVLKFLGIDESTTRTNSKYSDYAVTRIFSKKTRAEQKCPSFYLFNFKNNNGFAVISADKRDSATVYMYSLEGNLDLDKMDNNHLISDFMEASENYHSKKIAQYNPEKFRPLTRPDIVIDYVRVADTLTYIAPMSDKKWAQGNPFNIYLNGTKDYNKPMGCGPLALSLVADIYQHPKSYSSYSFNWNLIDQMKNGNDLVMDLDGALEVSKLLYAAGVATNVSYGEKSIVSDPNLLRGIRKMGFSCDDFVNFADNYGKVTSSIVNKRPVIMTGTPSDGHAWLVDGYLYVYNDVKAYDQYGNFIPNTMLEVFNYSEYKQYIHCNYGWGGKNDGNALTYQKTIMESYPTKAWYYTDVFWDLDGKKFTNVRAICNIKPN